jgi:alkylated DNA repair dioxygenase AlkB
MKLVHYNPFSTTQLWMHEELCFQKEAVDFQGLQSEIAWEFLPIQIFGKTYLQPRGVCLVGDAGVRYRYSGSTHFAKPWPKSVWACKQKVETFLRESKLFESTKLQFNSCLCNLYRSGQDSMGWHADDEKELGPEPLIVSVSFGQTRRFCVRPTKETRTFLSLELPNESVLIMAGAFQKEFQHSVPKSQRVDAPRINLTFRRVWDV